MERDGGGERGGERQNKERERGGGEREEGEREGESGEGEGRDDGTHMDMGIAGGYYCDKQTTAAFSSGGLMAMRKPA